MAKDKRRKLLEGLKNKKYSCTLKEAEDALRAWGFSPGRTKGHAQVWDFQGVTLTVHQPHGKAGKNNLDPGAVAMVIKKIEEVEIIQQREKEGSDDH